VLLKGELLDGLADRIAAVRRAREPATTKAG
jgi:hypothetical protein